MNGEVIIESADRKHHYSTKTSGSYFGEVALTVTAVRAPPPHISPHLPPHV